MSDLLDDVSHYRDVEGLCWLSGPGFSGLPCTSHAVQAPAPEDSIEAAKSRRIKTQQQAIEDLRVDRSHLEERLNAVREYVDDPGNWSALDGRRTHLLALLDSTPDPREHKTSEQGDAS